MDVEKLLTVSISSKEEQYIVANLLELYIYDLSKIVPNKNFFKVDQHGRFGYPNFDKFWSKANCKAYLFRLDGQLIGFALIHDKVFYKQDISINSRVIGEFFILNQYRNLGIGVQAAIKVISLEPGYWEMRVIPENTVAMNFWQKVVAAVPNATYKAHDKYDHQWCGKVFTVNN